MLTSLKLFLEGIARRWWLWAVGVPSGILTISDMYLPQSSGLLAHFRAALPAMALLIIVLALIAAAFQTYHELWVTAAKDYDPKVGEALHQLYVRGRDIASGAGGLLRRQALDPQAWVDEVEEFLSEHLPSELRMLQTAGDDQGPNFVPMRIRRIEHPNQLRPKVAKLRLIMGRYEERQ